MSNRRTFLDFPRNEAGLVSEFIGTAYDTVKSVADNLDEIARLDGVLAEIPTLAQTTTQAALDAALPVFKAEIQPMVDSAEDAADRAEAAAATISDQMPVQSTGTASQPVPDNTTVASGIGRIPYLRLGRVAIAPALVAATADVPMASFVGDVVDPKSATGFLVKAFRSGSVVPVTWSYLPDTNAIRVVGAQVGDVPVAVDIEMGVGDISRAPVTAAVSGSSSTKQLHQWIGQMHDDLTALALPTGSGLIGFSPSSTYPLGSVGSRLNSLLHVAAANPEDYIDLVTNRPGPDWTSWDWQPAIEAAFGASKRVMIGRDMGVRTTVNVPAGCVIDGSAGGVLQSWGSITTIKLADDAMVTFLKMRGDNKQGLAIQAMGTENGPGVAPTWRYRPTVFQCEFTLFNVSVEFNYVKEGAALFCRTLNNRYGGMFGYSAIDTRFDNNVIDGLDGERDSGELNAYGVVFSSKVQVTDFVRYPKSERCSGRFNLIKNIPVWHAMDTHGGNYIDFSDNIIINCRRGIILTNLGTSGAKHCMVSRNKLVNLTDDVNSNTTRTSDAAFWDVGATSDFNYNNTFTDNLVIGHGSSFNSLGAVFYENVNKGSFSRNRLFQCRTAGVRSNGKVNAVFSGVEFRDIQVLKISAGGLYDNALCFAVYNTDNTLVVDSPIYISDVDTATHNLARVGLYISSTDPNRNIILRGGTTMGITDIVSPATATGVTGEMSGRADLTITGTTAPVSGLMSYTVVDKMVTMNMPSITGSSNSGAATLTGLPASLRPSSARIVLVRVMDNGIAQLGTAIFATDGTLTLTKGADQMAFTASGNKGILQSSLTYLL